MGASVQNVADAWPGDSLTQAATCACRLSDLCVEMLLRHSEEPLADAAQGVIACMSFTSEK